MKKSKVNDRTLACGESAAHSKPEGVQPGGDERSATRS